MTIQEYIDEMPAELRRVIDSLNSDIGLAVFLLLLKKGEMSFTEIVNELEVEHNSTLAYHIKKLQKSSLVKNVYVKRGEGYSYYDVTEFGECVINNLMNIFRVGGNT